MNSWENGIIKSNPIVRINLLTVPYCVRMAGTRRDIHSMGNVIHFMARI